MMYALVENGFIQQVAHGIEPPSPEWSELDSPIPPRPSGLLRPRLTADLEWVEGATDEDRARDVRATRNTLLAQCDWTQIPDNPLTTSQREAWATYRQALRAIPDQEGFPLSVQWPVPPA